MNVTFYHPLDSRVFKADVDKETTVKTCMDNLATERFIEPAPKDRPYAVLVRRTQRQALPQMTMAEAGVEENDDLNILQMERGASHRVIR